MSDIIGLQACAEALRRMLDEITVTIQRAEKYRPQVLDTDMAEPTDARDQRLDARPREDGADSTVLLLGRMHNQLVQLSQLEQAVRAQVASNQREARKNRLIPVRHAIDTMVETVKVIQEANTVLTDDNQDEAVVKEKIETALHAITALDQATRDLFASL